MYAIKLEGVLEDNILALLCWSDKYFLKIREKVKAEFFSLPSYQQIAEKACEFIDKYAQPPKATLSQLLEPEIKAKRDGGLIAQTLDAMASLDLGQLGERYVLDELDKFLRTARIKLAIDKAAIAIADDDVAAAEAVMGIEQRANDGDGAKSIAVQLAERAARATAPRVLGDVIKQGDLVMLLGPPWGGGKSTFVCSLVRALTLGDDFLGMRTHPQRVLYLALERGGGEVLDRLSRWVLYRNRISLITERDMPPDLRKDRFDDVASHLDRLVRSRHQGDGRRLEKNELGKYVMRSVQFSIRSPVTLVVIDHLQNLFQIAKTNEYGPVSSAIEALSRVCKKTGVTFIVLHHQSSKESRSRGAGIDALGSTAYLKEADVLLERTKSGDSFILRGEVRGQAPLPKMRTEINLATGEAEYEMFEERTVGRPATKLSAATGFLRELLSDGKWHPQTEVEQEARKRDISPATLQNAATKTLIERRKGGVREGWQWKLKE